MSDMIIRIAAGALFLTVGIVLLLKQRKKRENCTASVSAEVTGYVTETHTDSDNMDTVAYYPVMRYCVSGHWYESRSDTGKGKQKYEIGEHVDILYDPENPECFILPGEKTNLITAAAFTLFGIGTIISALLG